MKQLKGLVLAVFCSFVGSDAAAVTIYQDDFFTGALTDDFRVSAGAGLSELSPNENISLAKTAGPTSYLASAMTKFPILGDFALDMDVTGSMPSAGFLPVSGLPLPGIAEVFFLGPNPISAASLREASGPRR